MADRPPRLGCWPPRCAQGARGPREHPAAGDGGCILYNPARVARKAKVPQRDAIRPLPLPSLNDCASSGSATQRSSPCWPRWVAPGRGARPPLRACAGPHPRRQRAEDRSAAHRAAPRPLAADLAAWRLACGLPSDRTLLFPSSAGSRWTNEAYKSWARRTFATAARAAGAPDATPYTLRHSFVSLLVAEGSERPVRRRSGRASSEYVVGHLRPCVRGSRRPPAR